jgi:hypothetical protein
MPAPADRKKVIRIAGLAVSLAGLLVAGSAFYRFVRSVAGNAVDGSAALTHNPEYYIRIGVYYSRGFTTGFFLCYFLMLFAIIAGSWVDQVRRTRREARAAAELECLQPVTAALTGLSAVPK